MKNHDAAARRLAYRLHRRRLHLAALPVEMMFTGVALEALDEDHAWLLPWGPRTHDSYAEGALIAAGGGTLLRKVAVNRETDWSQPANDVVRGITRKLAKKFLYRGNVASGVKPVVTGRGSW